MSDNGFIVVISGFSGAGKGTIMKELTATYPDAYALSISATTRNPRPGEVDGREYFFVNKDKFKQMIADDDLLEYNCYVDNYYGTPKSYVEKQLSMGRNVVLEIDINGAKNIKKLYPQTKLVFVCAPSATELYQRLTGRGTETQEVINQRMQRANEEAMGVEIYDYLLVNDDVKAATERLHKLLLNERQGNLDLNAEYTVANQIDFINETKEELLAFSKGE